MTTRRDFVFQWRNAVKDAVYHQGSMKNFYMMIQANVRVVGIWTKETNQRERSAVLFL